jgi:hypothetical protein
MNHIIEPTTLDSFSAFLKYGPIGLAGLMLILVIFGLSIGHLTESRERLLTRFMYIGAFCFSLAVAANFFSVAGAYPLHFNVWPLTAGSAPTLPPPIIQANHKILDRDMTYLVKSEVEAIVDVSDAINFVKNLQDENRNRQQTLASAFIAQTDALKVELNRIPQIIQNNCSGGPHGIDAGSNPAVIASVNRVLSGIDQLRASATASASTP